MHNNILKIILYFDVFSYPLKEEEIVSYSRRNRNDAFIMQTLNDLRKKGLVKYQDGYYFVGDPAKIERRKKGNILAEKRLQTAMRYTRIISWFPFVRSIMLSGSISKGYMGENDDIDYFIVTKPGRLWIARTLLTVFKKIFLRNSYRNFCINFFLDSKNLEIKEKSRYSATEIIFLLPVFKSDIYYRIIQKNLWVKKFYPEFEQKNNKCIENEIWLKKWIEKLFNNRLGDKIEDLLFRKSVKFIKRKYSKPGNQSFENNFSLKRNELRYFPDGKHDQINRDFNLKINEFENRFGLALSDLEKLKAIAG